MSKIATVLVLSTLLAASGQSFAEEGQAQSAIEAAVHSNADRKPEDASRDGARHPVKLMEFLELEPTMTIAEVNPGGGWYTRILAPFVRDNGAYVGLEHHPDIYEAEYPNYAKGLRAFPAEVADTPAFFGENAIGTWIPHKEGRTIDNQSVDAVIAVRALHNWMAAGFFDDAADQVWNMLKMGGTFGVVQHRMDEDFSGSLEEILEKGRWKQSALIAAIEGKGFEFVEASEMNANPKDTKDYPAGVWTLPPAYDLGDEDREKYTAIGESDRMTLKFKKVDR